DLGLRRCGLALRHGCEDRRERQQQRGHFNIHGSAPLISCAIITCWYYWVPLKVMVLCGTSVVNRRGTTMASVSKRRQKGGDETAVRERILEAAFAAFIKSGYATASTLEIATRACVSKR